MATIKLKFRPSSIPGKEGVLVYQVTQARVIKQIKTGCKLFEAEWNSGDIHIVTPSREEYIKDLKIELAEKEKRIRYIIKVLEQTLQTYTAEDIIKAYMSPEKQYDTLFTFTRNVIASLNTIGKTRTAESCIYKLNSSIIKTLGLKKNTSSFYMGILRAIYNRAVDKGLVMSTNPFKNVFTGMDKTIKRAIDVNSIHRIIMLDFSDIQRYDFARDMFLFSFYTRGMSFVDMAFLKKKDLKNGILSYKRQKSGQQLFIHWENCMQHIVDKYDTDNSPYLLPIITKIGTNERKQYLSKIHNVNRNLQEIGHLLGLELPLTMYVARHSWANIAYNNNIPISVISEGLGHDSEKTTRIYLSSLNANKIDDANRMILEFVRNGK